MQSADPLTCQLVVPGPLSAGLRGFTTHCHRPVGATLGCSLDLYCRSGWYRSSFWRLYRLQQELTIKLLMLIDEDTGQHREEMSSHH
jgi:hypothetical protein